MKIVAIIQARMGSSRLPNKVLAEINGKTLIEIMIDRMRHAKLINKLVVATTDSQSDDVLNEWLLERGVNVFRGSEVDVLDRFYNCALLNSADIVVRLTADDPLKDPEIIDRAIGILIKDTNLDYVSNTLNPTFPEGLDVEVLKFSALERAHREAVLLSDREHVTPYIWRNVEKFVTASFTHNENLNHWRWTVDKKCDLDFIREVLGGMGLGHLVRFEEIISHIKKNPSLMEINMGTVRNEGYLKSLKLEKT